MSTRPNLLLPDLKRWPADRPVIELDRVSKRFGNLEVIKDLSLTVETGKTTVIAGQSGSGKSVLLRLMNGLTLPDTGRVLLFGEDLRKISERRRTELRKRCTMVFQSYALIDSLPVWENIAFSLLQNTRMKRRDARKLADDLLAMLELADATDAMPSDLSGGMKKRVALARAVISNPEVVLFDEPTTGLDPVMIEFVDELIRRTQAEYEITSVIISHDMASNRRLADTMCILSDGAIVEQGPFAQIAASEQPAVKAFMANAVTSRNMGGATSGDDDDVDALGTPIVEVEGIHKSFGKNHVLKGISLKMWPNRICVVIGGSGSGKSVLIKHIIGLMKPDQGSVKVFGEDLSRMDGRALQGLTSKIGMLFQGAALFDSMTIEQNIAFPVLEARKLRRGEVRDRVGHIAERLQVQDILHRRPDEISNGERKRVGLARALITEPSIMIYDEPTTGQDPIMMRRVDDMIVEASENFDITSIVISHDMLSTFRIADQIIMIYKGEKVADGGPDSLRTATDKRVQEFIFAGSD